MKVYKGTDKDMKCRGKAYAIGETATEDKASLCNYGIHACEYPLDVFNYYSPSEGSRYFVGELDGVELGKSSEDTKVVGKKLTLKAELGIPGLVSAAVEYINERIITGNNVAKGDDYSAATNTGYMSAATNTGYMSAATNTGDYSAATNTGNYSAATNTGNRSAATNTGNRSAATNTGNYSAATNTGNRSAATNTGNYSAATNTGYMSAATNTGDYSAATNTGYMSAATNTGDYSAATNTGNRSAASAEGQDSIAIAMGYQSKAAASLGSWIVLAEWQDNEENDLHIIDVKSGRVDGETLLPGVFYQLVNGKFVEAKEDGDE